MLTLIEKTAAGFRATTGKPLEAEAEGTTREDTLNLLRSIVAKRLASGMELVELDIPASVSLRDFAGDMSDDPLYDEWVAEMKVYREQREAELAES